MINSILLLQFKEESRDTVALLDSGGTIHFDKKPLVLFNEWCLNSGSTAEGRMKSFQYLTNSKQKAAILVNEKRKILFFPTVSKNDIHCIWINNKKVLRTKQINSNCTEITFINGMKITLDLNRRILEKQMKRCSLFYSKLQ